VTQKSRQILGFFLAVDQSYRSDRTTEFWHEFHGVIFLAGPYRLTVLLHGFQGRNLGSVCGCLQVSLLVFLLLPNELLLLLLYFLKMNNKFILVCFPILGFSLAGCQKFECAHMFCDCCSLLFFLASCLVMCVSAYEI
jgi:hypothetical protein